MRNDAFTLSEWAALEQTAGSLAPFPDPRPVRGGSEDVPAYYGRIDLWWAQSWHRRLSRQSTPIPPHVMAIIESAHRPRAVA
jgi:hypothetical protein